MSDYVSRVSADLQQRYAGQPEYLQAVLTWLEMIAPALEDNPIYERVDLLTRMVEPDRMLTFTVPWMDDQGMPRGSKSAPPAARILIPGARAAGRSCASARAS